MDSTLPNKFDVIVVGTGLVESMVAAAASRVGKTVLHIDNKDYYGGVWASFNLQSIQNILNQKEVDSDINIDLESEEKLVSIGNNQFIKDVQQEWHLPDVVKEESEKGNDDDKKEEPVGENAENLENKESPKEENKTNTKKQEWTKQKLLENSRKFNIDLAPKLNFARGSMVEVLISSNIARYSEFRSVSRILTYINDELQAVPSSRSDIFANTKVSVIDKRMLMKLLTTCMESKDEDFKEFEQKTFRDYLKHHKLSADLIHYILYAIGMCNDETPCLEGVKRIRRFLNSLGRFGKTPFLFSMYGSGEIPQAFCRMSAVFGGIYALNQPLRSFVFNNNNEFKSLICGNQKLSADFLVSSYESAPKLMDKCTKLSYMSRAIFILDRSIMPSNAENLTLLLFPTENKKDLCYIIEAGSLTGTCPKGIYILYMFMKQRDSAKTDFKYFVDKLLTIENCDSNKPNILWSMYYSSILFEETADDKYGSNVYVTSGPELDLDYDQSVEEAKNIFEKMYPGEEMLPRAPDPEEIIIGDEDAVDEPI